MIDVSGIYLIRNQINVKVYVGQSYNIAGRWKSHVKEAKRARSNSHLYKALRKYGFDVFILEVLEVIADPTQEFLDVRETYWVKHYDACNPDVGYNFRPGGQGSQVVDAEARKRIASKLRGRKLSQEQIEIMRANSTGKACTESAKQKISAFHKGIVADKAEAEKLKKIAAEMYEPIKKAEKERNRKRVMNTDSYKTAEFKERVSKRFKGKTRSPEVRKNMSEAAKNRDPVAEAHRIEAVRLVTKARWAAYRARKEEELCSV